MYFYLCEQFAWDHQDQLTMEIKKASQSVKTIVVKKLLDLDPTLLSPPRIPSSRPASPVTAAERVAQQEQAMNVNVWGAIPNLFDFIE